MFKSSLFSIRMTLTMRWTDWTAAAIFRRSTDDPRAAGPMEVFMAKSTQLAIDPFFTAQMSEKPNLILVHDASNYDDLKRTEVGVAARGIHPRILGLFVGCYAAMLGIFWVMFAWSAAAALILTIVTILMVMYFSLIIGGIALADSPAPGERQRSFKAFLQGPVDTAAGIISGREAAVQILLLPVCLVALAIIIGAMARMSQMS